MWVRDTNNTGLKSMWVRVKLVRHTNNTELKEQWVRDTNNTELKCRLIYENTELKEDMTYNFTSITVKASAITAQVTCIRIKELVCCPCAGIINLCVVAR